ncbi:MAG: lipid-A-disaccharide synthase [Crocinitomicaceae bacterium]|nr:lipid-A-disaccharide synthase [Crocinitomicaceae bacterium]
MKKLKLYIIAGEASGDLHGSNLMKHLKAENSEIEFRFWGGDKMKQQGGTLVKHISDLAFMGFLEVIKNLKTILNNIRFCKKDIETFKPDVLILIDYPGFNLRIAEWAKENGIKVYYYISPQVWAWKQSRVHKIKKCVDELFVILPFEKDFYKKFAIDVHYLGHPLLDAVADFRSTIVDKKLIYSENNLSNKPIIALLPGSRSQEVSVKLPIMLEAVRSFDSYQIIIAGAPSLSPEFYQQFIKESDKIIFGKTYDILEIAEAAVVTSGTATLETALFHVPQVVCYKSSELSYQIAKRLIKIKFISLVNLILNREVVKELIQQDCNPTKIQAELEKIIKGGANREKIENDYKELQQLLGSEGASKKIAHKLLKTIQEA